MNEKYNKKKMYKISFKQTYVNPTDNISKNSIVEDVLEAVYTSKTPTLKPLPNSNSGSDFTSSPSSSSSSSSMSNKVFIDLVPYII